LSSSSWFSASDTHHHHHRRHSRYAVRSFASNFIARHVRAARILYNINTRARSFVLVALVLIRRHCSKQNEKIKPETIRTRLIFVGITRIMSGACLYAEAQFPSPRNSGDVSFRTSTYTSGILDWTLKIDNYRRKNFEIFLIFRILFVLNLKLPNDVKPNSVLILKTTI